MKAVPKLETGVLDADCTNLNLVAFGVDDGVPEYLQLTLQIIKDEKIPITFFVQGTALRYGIEDGNFTNAYREMLDLGHQIGLHTMSHPHMESVKTEEDVELEISRNVDTVKAKLNIEANYFRPPFGTVGSRRRQALGRQIRNPRIIMWSIDTLN